MELTPEKVTQVIDDLGLTRATAPNSGGWLSYLCQFHNDTRLGSCFINLENGVSHCYSCGENPNLYALIQKCNPGLSHKETIEFMGGEVEELDENFDPGLDTIKKRERLKARLEQRKNKSEKKEAKPVKPTRVIESVVRDFDPEEFEYTKSRGFTSSFIREHDIKFINNQDYSNYIRIPIIDRDNGVDTYEYKKVAGKITPRNKVRYAGGSNVNHTIWPIHKLNYDEDLYICEGIAGVPKVWEHLSKNVCAVFGTAITPEQMAILKKFTRKKIFIPDWDIEENDHNIPSLVMISKVNAEMGDVWLLPVHADDKQDNFVEELSKPIERAGSFIFMRSGLFDFQILY